MRSRYVIFGAGGIGGTIAAQLHASGVDVAVIARGAHLEAIRENGLLLRTPRRDYSCGVAAFAGPVEAAVSSRDIVLLTLKSQDTLTALDALVAAGAEPVVVCAQNGVENERSALRRFSRVYGSPVDIPAEIVAPGVVHCYGAPNAGVLDVGRYPSGVDPTARRIAADLTAAGVDSRAVEEIMRFKYAKLFSNLSNALELICGPDGDPRKGPVFERACEEARRCYEAAGIAYASDEEFASRLEGQLPEQPVLGVHRSAGSTYQGFVRGNRSIETDYLNGEIVLLGRRHGVATPTNELLQRLGREVVVGRRPPAAMTMGELGSLVGR